MHGAARLDISQIQPNTGDAGGEENDGISPGAGRIAIRDLRNGQDRLIWFMWCILFIWTASLNQRNEIRETRRFSHCTPHGLGNWVLW